jgi:hypothetical protein
MNRYPILIAPEKVREIKAEVDRLADNQDIDGDPEARPWKAKPFC